MFCPHSRFQRFPQSLLQTQNKLTPLFFIFLFQLFCGPRQIEDLCPSFSQGSMKSSHLPTFLPYVHSTHSSVPPRVGSRNCGSAAKLADPWVIRGGSGRPPTGSHFCLSSSPWWQRRGLLLCVRGGWFECFRINPIAKCQPPVWTDKRDFLSSLLFCWKSVPARVPLLGTGRLSAGEDRRQGIAVQLEQTTLCLPCS